MKKKRSRKPAPVESNWVEWGGERIFAVDFTEGGAPIGLTAEELDNDPEPMGIHATWADARDVLRELLRNQDAPSDPYTIGRIRFLGEGLSNVVYGASVQFTPGQESFVVVKLPSRDANPDRAECLRMEAELLGYLCHQPLPFLVPRPLGEIRTSAGLAVVQEWMDGMDVDLRAPRFPGGRPWELVARVAAAVHAIDPAPLRDQIRGHATRSDHALEFGSVLNELDEPEARDTEAWVRDHLPPATPSHLLHGDLLGQNLRVSLWEPERIGVIDWAEARLGDPAYDLAIVTRGRRKPFATSDGLLRLLEAYNGLAAFPLRASDVQLYELILAAHLYRAVARDYGVRSPHAENQRSAWRSILNRASRAKAR